MLLGELFIFGQMFYIRQHILRIIEQYQLQVPLHHYLRSYFKKQPKLGSRDRRSIADAVYAFYRAKPFLEKGNDTLEDVQKALLWVNTENVFLRKVFHLDAVTAWHQTPTFHEPLPELSVGLSFVDYAASLLQQPNVFIRLMHRELENLQKVLHHFKEAEVINTPFFKNRTIRLPGNCQLQNILQECDYIVQDLSSQLTLQIALSHPDLKEQPQSRALQVWDVCSGAGGKSILLKSILPNAAIVATDIRESILHNLRSRIALYKLPPIVTLKADVAVGADVVKPHAPFDFIICDVPCSGSGTWARNPEQHYFFNPDTLTRFTQQQNRIALNAWQHLKPGGYLCYITCSVFKAENENIVEQLTTTTEGKLLHQQIINGMQQQADSMFMALLKK